MAQIRRTLEAIAKVFEPFQPTNSVERLIGRPAHFLWHGSLWVSETRECCGRCDVYRVSNSTLAVAMVVSDLRLLDVMEDYRRRGCHFELSESIEPIRREQGIYPIPMACRRILVEAVPFMHEPSLVVLLMGRQISFGEVGFARSVFEEGVESARPGLEYDGREESPSCGFEIGVRYGECR